MPSYLRSDNGPEFVSTALLQWVNDEALDLLLIEQENHGKMVLMKALMASLETNAYQPNGSETE